MVTLAELEASGISKLTMRRGEVPVEMDWREEGYLPYGGDIREKLSGLNSEMQELISSMLSREPSQRKSAIEYLQEWCSRILPRSFCTCLFPLSVLLLHPVYQQADMRVALLRHNFASLVWLTAGARKIGGTLGFRGQGREFKMCAKVLKTQTETKSSLRNSQSRLRMSRSLFEVAHRSEHQDHSQLLCLFYDGA
eukprot:g18385.t1